MPIDVLLVDRREFMRAGIKATSLQCETLRLAGEAPRLRGIFEFARSASPCVLIVSASAIEQANPAERAWLDSRERLECTPLLILADQVGFHDASPYVREIASGYVSYDATAEELSCAIRSVAKGRVFISYPGRTRQLRVESSHSPISAPAGASEEPGTVVKTRPDDRKSSITQQPPVSSPSHRQSPAGLENAQESLSEREREVLQLIAQGMTNKQAAAELFLSVKTVETYRSRIMKKHGFRDRLDLMRYAQQISQQRPPSQPAAAYCG